WITDEDSGADFLAAVTVGMKMSVEPAEEGVAAKRLSITIENTPESGVIARMGRQLQVVLAKPLGTPPPGTRMTLNLGPQRPYLFRKDRDALSAAAGVLMGAAFSGKAPTGTVIGHISP